MEKCGIQVPEEIAAKILALQAKVKATPKPPEAEETDHGRQHKKLRKEQQKKYDHKEFKKRQLDRFIEEKEA